jgi:hypothetical protein
MPRRRVIVVTYFLLGALMSAFCAARLGYEGQKLDDYVIMPALAGVFWPITLCTYIPFLIGQAAGNRARLAIAEGEKKDAELAENMAEVDRILDDGTVEYATDKVAKFRRTPSGKLVAVKWMGGPL